MEIGQLLKEEREAKQLTLDDIQEMTKIQKRYLQAIEDDDYKRLPGRFYARAFIKEYALVLGLEPDTLLVYFDRTNVEETETAQYSNVRRSRRTRAPKSSAILSFFPTIIVIILIVGVLFIAWTLTQKALSTDGSNQNKPTESDEIIRDVEQPEKEKPVGEDESENDNDDDSINQDEGNANQGSEFIVVEIGSGISPQSELDFVHNSDEVILSFDVVADAYVSIVGESGKNYFDGIMSPNGEIETYNITEEGNVFLNVGNTAGITIKINDIEMDYPIEPAESVHQKYLINLKKTR